MPRANASPLPSGVENPTAEIVALTQALIRLNAEREFAPLVSAILQTACRLCRAEAACLLLANRRTGLLEIAAVENMPSELVLEYQRRPARASGLSAHDRPPESDADAARIAALAAGGCASSLTLPILNQATTLGALTLAGAHPLLDRPQDRVLADLLLAYAAQALENAYLIFHLREHNARQELMMTKLQNAQNHLKRTEKVALVGKVAAAVAHEVRNPLTIIQTTLQMILEKQPPAHPERALYENMLSKVRSVDTTVKELLGFARPVALRPEPVNLAEAVRKTTAFVAKKAESKKQTLQVDLEPSLPRVLLDAAQTERILLNLLLNALEAAPEGGWVQLRAWREPGQPEVRVAVTDNGPGVAAAAAGQIFEPFFTTRPDGTGLGLFLIKHLLEEMQGRIELTNPGGVGAEFMLRLPLASEARAESAPGPNK